MTINIYHPYQKWETSAVIFNIIVRTSAKDTLQRQFAHYLHSVTIPLLGSQIIYSAVSNVNLLFKMVSSVKPVTTVKLIRVDCVIVLSSQFSKTDVIFKIMSHSVTRVIYNKGFQLKKNQINIITTR